MRFLRLLTSTLLLMSFADVALSQDASQTRAVLNSIGQQLRFIPAGSYIRGAKDPRLGGFYKEHPEYHIYDEVPRHPVRFTKPFYLATTEVTVGQFRRFVDATGYQTTAETNGSGIVGFDPHDPEEQPRARLGFRKKSEFTWKNPGFEQSDTHPVTGVSFEDAQAFCRWLSEAEGAEYRLPTEAEWEYACRAGTESYFSWGETYDEIHKLANVGNAELEREHPQRVLTQWVVRPDRDPGDPHVYTAPVGSYPVNDWGIHDMHGNVWEWCQDRYLDTAYEKYKAPEYNRPIERAIDPLNEESFTDEGDWRVIRGGSWFTSPLYCRSAIRSFYGVSDGAAYLGFRVVREASPDEIAESRSAFEAEERARTTVEGIVGQFQSPNGVDLRIEYQQPPTAELTRELQLIAELTEVNFSAQGQMKGELIADIAAIRKLRDLTLWWSGNDGVTDEHFAPLVNCRSLETLRIGAYPTLTDGMLQYVTPLTGLQSLLLGGENLTDEGLKQLASLKQLRELDIQGTQSNGAVLEALKDAPLESLEVRRLTDETAAFLTSFPNLKRLSIYDSQMTNRGFQAIAGLKRLEFLTMRNCPNIPAESFKALANMRSLKRLDMRDTPLGDDTLELITNLQLDWLHLDSPNVTDVGMRHICGIITLNVLVMGPKTQVTDRGLKHLWRLTRVNQLDLHSPLVTGSGLEPLTELPSLNVLRLSSPKLTDDVFGYLSETPALSYLELGWNVEESSPHLTDQGLQLLADKTNWGSIQLNRRGTAITEEGIQKLRNNSNIPQINVNQ